MSKGDPETRFLGWATIFLGAMVALSALLQAWIAVEERHTPFRTALFSNQIELAQTAITDGTEACHIRTCRWVAGKANIDQCIAHYSEKAKAARSALDRLSLTLDFDLQLDSTLAGVDLSIAAGFFLPDPELSKTAAAEEKKKDQNKVDACRSSFDTLQKELFAALGIPTLFSDLKKRFKF